MNDFFTALKTQKYRNELCHQGNKAEGLLAMKLYAHKVDEKVLATRGTVANYLEEVA